MDGMFSMNTHLESVLGFRVVFDIDYLFIVMIWHGVKKVILMTCQTCTSYTTISDLVDLCPHIWYNNSKEIFFLRIPFCGFDI